MDPLPTLEGLSDDEALRRLRDVGPNELPSARPRSPFYLFSHIVAEPMFLLLLASSALYFVLGDWTEAIILLGSVFVIVVITFYQEHRTEHALLALRQLSSPRALVIRGGHQKRIPGREIVPDDLIIVSEGDRIPADAVVLWQTSLLIDESLLTGESAPVMKSTVEGANSAFSGTVVTRGKGLARVTATGPRTEIGIIGKHLQSIENTQTRLQKEMLHFVRIFAVVGVLFCILVALVYVLKFHHWIEGGLVGITTAMSLLPEEFPVVLTLFYAMGAWRLSRQNVLTRRIPAIENLGAATVLCVDKTGTLTENRMVLRQLRTKDAHRDLASASPEPLPEAFHELVEYAIMASHRDPFDPMDKAIRDIGLSLLAGTEHLHEEWRLSQEYPLSPELLAMSCLWQSPDQSTVMIAAKGAPEAIADLCHLSKDDAAFWIAQTHQMATSGLRVLGIAKATVTHEGITAAANQHDFEFHYVGLVGFEDPIRAEVPQAIADCKTAGIRVIMMTGDYPATAFHIARTLGLHPSDRVLLGKDVTALSDDDFKRQLCETSVIARASPEQKLRIVRVLQAAGEIVAMTGDGVNDGPSLKAADIGIAMGGRGTDVAREAADLILVDDNFASIVAAIRSGRRIFQNIRMAIYYLLAIHIPIAGLSIFPLLLGWPLLLFPIHIVFLELIIDPTSSLVFEAEPGSADDMKQPPRPLKTKLLDRSALAFGSLQGLVLLGLALGLYAVSFSFGHSEDSARALTFAGFVLSTVALILVNRSPKPFWFTLKLKNARLWTVIVATCTMLGLSLFVPFLHPIMRFAHLQATDVLLAVGSGVAGLFLLEGIKAGLKRYQYIS